MFIAMSRDNRKVESLEKMRHRTSLFIHLLLYNSLLSLLSIGYNGFCKWKLFMTDKYEYFTLLLSFGLQEQAKKYIS